ncbi:MAG: hypothetical protein ABSG86_29165 [Thermoguttaceae bacterium]
MRLLFAIPHYYKATPERAHGSLGTRRLDRARALTLTISAVRELLGGNQSVASPAYPQWTTANRISAESIEIVVCNTHGQHVLADLPLPKGRYRVKKAAIRGMMR